MKENLKTFSIIFIAAAFAFACHLFYPYTANQPESIDQLTDTIVINSNGNDTINAVGNFIINVELNDEFGQMVIMPEYVKTQHNSMPIVKMKTFNCIDININGNVVYYNDLDRVNKYGATWIQFRKYGGIIYAYFEYSE